MIQFTKLRINGFKSFPERTEFDIQPGLSGIVGPNGCGKSNVVEALRWVMGENSAKRMRGDGMDDVIFNGTAARPGRNLAEVALLLDNSSRTAPAAWNGSDEIEIVRRIERGQGSTYKINGKIVRARDVQMLFADTVTGANSPALVSQGRVTQIINAKPIDRRIILEESAGISGLYSRRHEAELRLRAADANMVRISDILGGMETHLSALKRQTRQATRYRNVNAQIRQMELIIAWLEWDALGSRLQAMQDRLTHTETETAEKMATVTQLTRRQETQAADIPALRQAEAEAAAALQALRIEQQRLDDDMARLENDLNQSRQQQAQAETDLQHEQTTAIEAAQAQEKLDEEQKTLKAEEDNDGDSFAEKESACKSLEEKVVRLEEQYAALMQGAAESRARRQALEQQIAANQDRLQKAEARKISTEAALAALPDTIPIAEALKKAEAATASLAERVQTIQANEDQNQTEQAALKIRLGESRAYLNRAESRLSEHQAETSLIQDFIGKDNNGQRFRPVLDSIQADAGFEKALARALGDTLLAATEPDAPSYWRERGDIPLPALPVGSQPLLPHVRAPEQIRLALSLIGVVEDEADGRRLADMLSPGQSLVSRSGTYWRWDGYTVSAGSTDGNAQRLEYRNRLETLNAQKSTLEKTLSEARARFAEAENALIASEDKARDLTQNLRRTEEELNAARARISAQRETLAREGSERARLDDILRMAAEDSQTIEDVLRWDNERLKAYDEDSLNKNREDTEKLRAALVQARDSYNAALLTFSQHKQRQSTRQARLHAIADERISLQNRQIRSRERVRQLEERIAALAEKIAALESQPRVHEDTRQIMLDKISGAAAARQTAADALASSESELSETARALKIAEAALAETREARAHAHATCAALDEQKTAMESHIAEQFSLPAAELRAHAGIDPDAEFEALDTLKQRKDKLLRERDNIGAVNLRADEEAQALEEKVGGLIAERNDLMQAIEELREGINTINREARERLLAAFEKVNAHFQQLFTRLFGGGQAHLAFIDSEDPLGAGLEVFAQPPGKTLQSLSLLSGGEQTLTSIALIFAMFLTNPSPICVLDEIDAPLDDANVDRVCNLLEDIAARGETRFIVITHHRLTMARMDRLYGVTMADRGVSQLLSVDLQQSFQFLEAA